MKKVGIIGGIGPEATITYYQSIIKDFQKRLGTHAQLPELVINSINMYKMFDMLEKKNFGEVVDYLSDAVEALEHAGADFVVMCGNTPHIVFNEIQENVNIPMMSMVETSYQRAAELGLKNLGLLGTKFTMENDFFKKPFIKNDLSIQVPNKDQLDYVHHKIVTELENGIVKEATRQQLITIVNEMIRTRHIDGVILGCTELPLILSDEDFNVPVLDIAQIHIQKIVDHILN
ncbi:MAG: amino acid racemase [Lentilactobacillus hilgardii]|nr:amino acid racemase [Lentilactobacillus hilgardii]MBZ2199870.1 aspartate racemase [Lentilactobacillus hilgardii]MBZ2202990.1 aspartate racemase [Lentilactobacillus hilgardii]